MLTDKRRKFLELFPDNKRSAVAGTFLKPIRDGITDPEVILTCAHEKALKDGRDFICEAIYKYMNEAILYINFLQDWEKLPREEKDYYKGLQAKKAIRQHMEKDRPTEKQLAYLKALGYRGAAPETKAHACELISTIKVFAKLQEA